MFTWRMEVKDETFTNLRDHPSVGQDYITPDAGVASLDDFSVDGAGNCLEARFRASPKFVDIRARDIVSLEVSEDGGSTWTPVYRGYVVTAGNPRSDAIQEYKLVGLRQRFFEITNPLANIFEGDVAEQVENVLTSLESNSEYPAGVVELTTFIGSTVFPLLNVTGLQRFPAKESYGATLQSIAEAAGRFIVASGETYTYDGVTYTEGDVVPACKFGVDGAGNMIFGRPQSADAVFSETGDNILADYTQVTGEEIFDNIELVYADDLTSGFSGDYLAAGGGAFGPYARLSTNNANAIPLTRTFSFGDFDATRKVNVGSPTTLMSSDVSVSSTSGSPSNPSGAFSGGTTTLPSGGATVTYINANGTGDGFIFEVTVTPSGGSPSLFLRFGQFFAGLISSVALDYSPFESLDETTTYRFNALPAANLSESGTLFFNEMEPQVFVSGSDVELTNLRIYVPDVDAGGTKSQQFASGFVRDVQQDVAEVTLVNQFGPVAPRMVWTPDGESPVTVPVERIQYTLTTNDGLITQYELGQAFDAELLSERAVLKGLAREAVSE